MNMVFKASPIKIITLGLKQGIMWSIIPMLVAAYLTRSANAMYVCVFACVVISLLYHLLFDINKQVVIEDGIVWCGSSKKKKWEYPISESAFGIYVHKSMVGGIVPVVDYTLKVRYRDITKTHTLNVLTKVDVAKLNSLLEMSKRNMIEDERVCSGDDFTRAENVFENSKTFYMPKEQTTKQIDTNRKIIYSVLGIMLIVFPGWISIQAYEDTKNPVAWLMVALCVVIFAVIVCIMEFKFSRSTKKNVDKLVIMDSAFCVDDKLYNINDVDNVAVTHINSKGSWDVVMTVRQNGISVEHALGWVAFWNEKKEEYNEMISALQKVLGEKFTYRI